MSDDIKELRKLAQTAPTIEMRVACDTTADWLEHVRKDRESIFVRMARMGQLPEGVIEEHPGIKAFLAGLETNERGQT